MAPPNPKKTKRSRKGRKAGRKNKAPQVSLAVMRYVKRMIHKTEENKLAAPVSVDRLAVRPYGIATATASTIINLTPVFSGVTQGTGQGNRIGNRIAPRSLSFKGYINYDTTGSIYTNKKPFYVKMVIGRRVADLDSPTNMSDMFQNGNSTVAPSNDPSDLYKWINKDVYKVVATRRFKLGTSAPTNSPETANLYNNDFSLSRNFSINLTKAIPKNIKYNDTTAAPTNCALYVWFFICHGNGYPISSTDYPACQIHYDTLLSYEDA